MTPKFILKLKDLINHQLPGEDAQFQMAPAGRSRLRSNFRIKPRKSGVLLLLYPKENKLFTSFILRPEYEGVHSGQVAFPGGRYEEDDKDMVDTALREAEEEIGVTRNAIQVLGELTSLYIPPSNFLVYPVIGWHEGPPQFIPDPAEVAEIIEVDIDTLVDKKIVRHGKIRVRDRVLETPYFHIKGHIVWGATAMILSEFLHIVRKIS